MPPTVLICIAHYLPGWRWGGPTRSIANLVDHLGGEFNFRILTADHDFGEKQPYEGIRSNEWRQVGKAKVKYLSVRQRTLWGMAKALDETPYDILYLNSLFHPTFTITPLLAYRLGLARRRPCIVAPRGEFARAALEIKAAKKSAYLKLARAVGIYENVRWQASSVFEANDIRRNLSGIAHDIQIAANLPRTLESAVPSDPNPTGVGTALRVALLSRLSRMKNLEFALQILATCETPVQFDIWGTIEDEAYWRTCQTLMEALPPHVSVTYRGTADQSRTSEILAGYDLMFMPSLGENYGHVIAEALAVGTPVLISDRTPWRNLVESGVGWDLPLDADGAAFRSALAEALRLRDSENAAWRSRVRNYAKRVLLASEALEANRRLFEFPPSNVRPDETRTTQGKLKCES